MTQMKGAFIFANKTGNSWLWKATKRERIEMAKQIASTVETADEEIYYIDTANLQDMPREERAWIAKKIVSTIPHDWGYTSC